MDNYYKINRLSYSKLKHLAVSYKNYLYHLNNDVHKKAFDLGRAYEDFLQGIFTNDNELINKYATADLRTKEGKALKDKGLTILSNSDYQTLQEMLKETLNSIYYNDLSNENNKWQEVFLFELKGREFKAKTDIVNYDMEIICDIKTIDNIQNYEKAIYNLKYYMQAGIYQQALKEKTGKTFNYLFYFIEKQVPYHDLLIGLDQEYIDYGLNEAIELINKLEVYENSNTYGGYISKDMFVNLPSWL